MEITFKNKFMTERDTLKSQLALAESSYATAKELNDHDSAYHCAETIARVNRSLALLDEQETKAKEGDVV